MSGLYYYRDHGRYYVGSGIGSTRYTIAGPLPTRAAALAMCGCGAYVVAGTPYASLRAARRAVVDLLANYDAEYGPDMPTLQEGERNPRDMEPDPHGNGGGW